MRALILSDIHSNIDALEAALEAAPEHDVVWNLGDVVGYNAAPNAVIERVRGLGNVFVRGNHDRACCGLMDLDYFNPIARSAAEWTKRQLDAEAMRWLKGLPQGPVCIPNRNDNSRSPFDSPSARSVQARDLPPRRPAADEVYDERSRRARDDRPTHGSNPFTICCVHGSPLDEDEYLLSVHDARPALATANGQVTFFGHTHVQGGFAANADRECFAIQPLYSEGDAAESYDLDLRIGATYLINPGSVGQPRDRDWRAAFAIYDGEAKRIAFWRVPYDLRLAQMRIRRAGLPDALAARLRVGR